MTMPVYILGLLSSCNIFVYNLCSKICFSSYTRPLQRQMMIHTWHVILQLYNKYPVKYNMQFILHAILLEQYPTQPKALHHVPCSISLLHIL